MSYTTVDRYGEFAPARYHAQKDHPGGPAGSTGTWWPDFGAPGREFSDQPRSHPASYAWHGGRGRKAADGKPSQEVCMAVPFRNMQPAKAGMLKTDCDLTAKNAARFATEKQAALRRADRRQLRADSWASNAAPRCQMAPASGFSASTSRSESALSTRSSATINRQALERNGLLVSRGVGQVADGIGGAAPRRHNSLTFRKNMFSRTAPGADGATRRRKKMWLSPMESGPPFDLQRVLPVPRGGWDSQPPKNWPEPEVAGRRELREC